MVLKEYKELFKSTGNPMYMCPHFHTCNVNDCILNSLTEGEIDLERVNKDKCRFRKNHHSLHIQQFLKRLREPPVDTL